MVRIETGGGGGEHDIPRPFSDNDNDPLSLFQPQEQAIRGAQANESGGAHMHESGGDENEESGGAQDSGTADEEADPREFATDLSEPAHVTCLTCSEGE